jgi:hypothetical protein
MKIMKIRNIAWYSYIGCVVYFSFCFTRTAKHAATEAFDYKCTNQCECLYPILCWSLWKKDIYSARWTHFSQLLITFFRPSLLCINKKIFYYKQFYFYYLIDKSYYWIKWNVIYIDLMIKTSLCMVKKIISLMHIRQSHFYSYGSKLPLSC